MRTRLAAKPAVWSILICVALFSAILLGIPASSYAGARYADGLEKVVASAQPGEKIPVLVQFYGAISRAEFHQALEGLTGDERREAGIELLRSNLFKQAGNAIAWIENEEAEGRAFAAYSFWLGNGYVMSLQADRVALLAEFPEVESIVYTPPRPIPEIDEGDPWTDPGEVELDQLVWGVEDIQTREMWDAGYTGEGILLAFIDTGCLLTHPDLAGHIWNNSNEIPDNGLDDDDNEYIDDIHGWNFVDDDNNVMDVQGHGTKVAGVLVGDGTMGDTTGVAPGAEIVVIRNYGVGHTSENFHSLAVQYAVGVGADFISCSMSYEHEGNEMDLSIRQTMEMVAELGIIQTNSMGNKGAFSGNLYNVNLPGRCPPPWLHPDQGVRGGTSAILGIGYYERSGANRVIGDHSTEGPAVWQEETFFPEYRDYPYIDGGLLKPDLVAPGNVTSTTWNPTPNTYYTGFTAESSATPHVAGALALLKQAHPDASIVDLVRALKMSALDRGDHGHDNIWGAGMLRIHDAHEYLTMWESRGYVQVSAFTQGGFGVNGFAYTIGDSSFYSFLDDSPYVAMSPGTYNVTAQKFGYEPIDNIQVTVTERDTASLTLTFDWSSFPQTVTLEPGELSFSMSVADTVVQHYTIANASEETLNLTGTLQDAFSGYFYDLTGEMQVDLVLYSIDVHGVAVVNSQICIAGKRYGDDTSPMIWRLDLEGNLVDSLAQPDTFGEDGLGDMAVTADGTVYAAPFSGANAGIIYELDQDWSVRNSITSPITPIRGLAFDDTESVLYLRETNGAIHKSTLDGTLVSSYPCPYPLGEDAGLLYYDNGRYGPELFVFSEDESGDLFIESLHFETGEFELINSMYRAYFSAAVACKPRSNEYDEVFILYAWEDFHDSEIMSYRMSMNPAAVDFPDSIIVLPGTERVIPVTFYGTGFTPSGVGHDIYVYFTEGSKTLLGNLTLFTTGMEDVSSSALPVTTELYPGYPNPFNPVTMLKYSLAQPGDVRIAVYNVLGQQVDVLYQGYHTAGTHQVSFDASDLASGLYLVQMETAGHQYLQKVYLLK